MRTVVLSLVSILVVLCALVPKSSAHGYKYVVRDTTAYLHEPKVICVFDVIYDYSGDFSAGILGGYDWQYEITMSGTRVTVRAKCDSVVSVSNTIGIGFYSGTRDEGSVSVPVRYRVVSDTGVRVWHAPLRIDMVPNYQTRKWEASAPFSFLNNTRDSIYIRSYSLKGRLDDSDWSVYSGSTILSASSVPGHDTERYTLELYDRKGSISGETRDTVSLQFQIVKNSVDTTVEAVLYLHRLVPRSTLVQVIDSLPIRMGAKTDRSVFDTVLFSVPYGAGVSTITTKPPWLEVATKNVNDTLVAAYLSASTTSPALLVGRPVFAFASEDFLGAPRADTLTVTIQFSTIDTDHSLVWEVKQLPSSTAGSAYRLSASGELLIPQQSNFVYSKDHGQEWIQRTAPHQAHSIVRLPDRSLVAHCTDSVLYYSSDDGFTWISLDSTIRLLRPPDDPHYRPGWQAIDVLYQVEGTSPIALWHYTVYQGGGSFRKVSNILQSSDGVHWSSHQVYDDRYSAVAVDSGGWIDCFDRMRPWGREDSIMIFQSRSAARNAGMTSVGLDGGGVYSYTDSAIMTDFMAGSIVWLGISSNRTLAASDGVNLWCRDTIGWHYIPIMSPQVPLRAVFFDEQQRLCVLTANEYYRSSIAFREVAETKRRYEPLGIVIREILPHSVIVRTSSELHNPTARLSNLLGIQIPCDRVRQIGQGLYEVPFGASGRGLLMLCLSDGERTASAAFRGR